MVPYAVVVLVALVALVVGVLIGRLGRSTERVVWERPASGVVRGRSASAAGVADDPELRRHLASDQLILAIKRYRELTGLGLKESKDAVEALRRSAAG